MKIWGLFGAIAVSTALITAPASAADISGKAPVYSKAPIAYDNWSPWMIRVRALGVLPRDGGTVDGAPALGLAYSDAVVPELDITYFFT